MARAASAERAAKRAAEAAAERRRLEALGYVESALSRGDVTDAFVLAADNGPDALRYLLERGIDPGTRIQLRDDEWTLPLVFMAAQPELAEILLAAGADPNATSGTGQTPLHTAAARGSLRSMEALLEAGANVDPVDDHGTTPLSQAAISGQMDALRRLLDAGADPGGGGAVTRAVGSGSAAVVRLLVGAGADPGCAPSDLCPLTAAAGAGRADLVSVLLDLGADPAGNGDGAPLRVAREAGSDEVVALLEAALAGRR